MLSDLVVIWRAWAVILDQRWVILVPFILWIGTVGESTFCRESFPFAESIHSKGRPSGASYGY